MNELQCEADWLRAVRSSSEHATGGVRLLTVCGPSGAGKTSVVSALAKDYAVYIETTDGNPHLKALLEGSDRFNAAENQGWFLRRIGENIAKADARVPLVLDQDPAAIVLAYSRMLRKDGKISELQYGVLVSTLLQTEQSLRLWGAPRTVLCLDAPAEALRQRVVMRMGASHTPPLVWFDRVRSHFLDLFSRFPNAIRFSTVELSVEQIASHARRLLQDGREATKL